MAYPWRSEGRLGRLGCWRSLQAERSQETRWKRRRVGQAAGFPGRGLEIRTRLRLPLSQEIAGRYFSF